MRIRIPSTGHSLLALPAHFMVVLAAALATCPSVAADDWPALRIGLWEFNRTLETSGTPGKTQTIQTKKCTSPSDDMKKAE